MKYKFNGKTVSLATFLIACQTTFAQPAFNVGTIAPGDSIVIYYDVTINTSCGCTQISNQGTVSGTGFANLNTNDPKTFAAGDPTITVLNLFPLPVRFYALSAVAVNGNIQVSWKVAAESNIIKYEIERSRDGISFTRIGELPALNISADHIYSYMDLNPRPENNFYRIKIIEQDARNRYSSIVRVSLLGTPAMSVNPNPVVNKQLTIQLSNLPKGSYNLIMVNNMGQTVYTIVLSHAVRTSVRTLTLPSFLSTGIYSIQVTDNVNTLQQRIIIE